MILLKVLVRFDPEMVNLFIWKMYGCEDHEKLLLRNLHYGVVGGFCACWIERGGVKMIQSTVKMYQ